MALLLYLRAFKILCLAELSMKKGFITSGAVLTAHGWCFRMKGSDSSP